MRLAKRQRRLCANLGYMVPYISERIDWYCGVRVTTRHLGCGVLSESASRGVGVGPRTRQYVDGV